ncbi:FAD-dependent oxidoreductase [Streptomyces aquilus]|uniref:FAD-dependent oxidoreductase n=1 Tax=Streptomyces aquilus TaxID=2548456 RepID=A0A3Q9C7K9_9ACTN|nr:FAD-dependent oxidoreductase [Streptomyces aquilus]
MYEARVSGGRGAFVVVGASLAGLRAVEAARAEGYQGRIVLIGAEPHLPYDRPPLSKDYLLAGAAPDFLSTETELREVLDVDLRLSSTATALNADDRTVTVDGAEIPYGKLLIATGATPRRLPQLAPLSGVHELRTLDDAQRVRKEISAGCRVVVIGAGFIGAETASSAKHLGADVVLLEAAEAPLVRALGETVGSAASALHERNGVRLVLSARVEGFVGQDAVRGVRLAGGEVLPADVVVVGVGVAPATKWLEGSGVELHPRDGGIQCDAMLRTSVPDVYAAGDVVHWPNAIMDSVMRLENWTNAAGMGGHAARNALWPETEVPYSTVPYFWSDWYGQRLQFVGTADADHVEFVSGDPKADRWVALYRHAGRLVGAAALNEPRRIMKYRRMIGERLQWEEALTRFPPDPPGRIGSASTP